MRKAVLLLSLIGAAMFSWASGMVLAQESTTLASERITAPGRTTVPGRTPAQSAIPGQYIVVLKDELNDEVRDPTAVAREHAQRHGAQVLHTYQHALEGYAARIPVQRLDEVRAEERVDYVELVIRSGKEALQNARSRPVSPYYSEMSREMAEQFNNAVRGAISPGNAVETLQSELQQIVEQG
jgi:Peptidase inhibitor I9